MSRRCRLPGGAVLAAPPGSESRWSLPPTRSAAGVPEGAAAAKAARGAREGSLAVAGCLAEARALPIAARGLTVAGPLPGTPRLAPACAAGGLPVAARVLPVATRLAPTRRLPGAAGVLPVARVLPVA